MKKIIILTLIFVMFAVPMLALGTRAAAAPDPALDEIINRVVNLIWLVITVIAVAFVMVAAFLFLTSGGDSEKVQKARDLLLYAIIGIVLGSAARGLAKLVIDNFKR